MEKIGHFIGSALLFYVIGTLSLTGIYLIYSAIHIAGILIGILQPPWYELDYLARISDGWIYNPIFHIIFGGIIFIYWDRRQWEKFEKRKQLRKKEDLFHKYKSFYEREKKRKRKKRKK